MFDIGAMVSRCPKHYASEVYVRSGAAPLKHMNIDGDWVAADHQVTDCEQCARTWDTGTNGAFGLGTRTLFLGHDRACERKATSAEIKKAQDHRVG